MLTLTSVFTIAFCLGAIGTAVEGHIPKTPSLELCPTAVLVNTKTINAGDHTIQHSTFLCPDDSLSRAAWVEHPGNVYNNRDVVPRNTAECRNNVPQCQCGQPAAGSCSDRTADAPLGSDCPILLDALQVVAQQTGPTFLTANNSFDLLTFGSCGVEFLNTGRFLGASSIEYCWDELRSSLGILFQQCLGPGSSATSVANIASNGFWNQQLFRVSP